MAGKKDKQVGTIDHKSGVTVPLMFNPNERGEHALTFNASFSDQKWIGRSAEDVKQQVRAYLDSCAKLDWVPVVEVGELHPFACNYPDHFVGIELERYYLAASAEKHNDGQAMLRKLRWEEFDEPHAFGDDDKDVSMDMRRIKRSREYHLFHADDVKAKLPVTEGRRDENKIYVIAYREETWAALKSVQDGIGRLKKMLRGLISTDAGHQKLLEVGSKMLKMLPPIEEPSNV
jgi:hypothetical protein